MQDKEHPGPTVNDHENDFLWGTRAISRAINRTERQTYHLLARGNIKSAQKKGATWVAHRQTLRREFGAWFVAYRNGGGRTLDIDRGETRTVIRAELAGDDYATACGIVARGSSPVLKLCRLLVDAGHDPSTPLEAWRNGVLCLRVRSIGEAADLRVNNKGTAFVRSAAVPTATPIDLNAPDRVEVAPGWIDWPPADDGAA